MSLLRRPPWAGAHEERLRRAACCGLRCKGPWWGRPDRAALDVLRGRLRRLDSVPPSLSRASEPAPRACPHHAPWRGCLLPDQRCRGDARRQGTSNSPRLRPPQDWSIRVVRGSAPGPLPPSGPWPAASGRDAGRVGSRGRWARPTALDSAAALASEPGGPSATRPDTGGVLPASAAASPGRGDCTRKNAARVSLRLS